MVGYKQALDVPSASHGSEKSSSILFSHLVQLWSLGEISASACQRIALAAHKMACNKGSLSSLLVVEAGAHTPTTSAEI